MKHHTHFPTRAAAVRAATKIRAKLHEPQHWNIEPWQLAGILGFLLTAGDLKAKNGNWRYRLTRRYAGETTLISVEPFHLLRDGKRMFQATVLLADDTRFTAHGETPQQALLHIDRQLRTLRKRARAMQALLKPLWQH